MPSVLTRQEIYNLVWAEPIRTVAKRLEISDVALAKACRRSNVPLPARGHWAKRDAGKKVFQPALPVRGFGETDLIEFGRRRTWWWAGVSDEEILNSPIPAAPSFPESLEEVAKRAQSLIGKVAVPRSLARAHPIIARRLEEDEARRQRYEKSPYPYSWDKPLFDSPLEQRRLRIVNALFLALSRCGCIPARQRGQDREFSVRVGDQHVRFSLEPCSTRGSARRKPGSERLELKLSLYEPPDNVRHSWVDQEQTCLEDAISDISTGLLVAGEWIYRATLERRHAWRVERKQELEEKIREQELAAMRREQEEREKAAKKRLHGLLSEAARWRRAADIRAYVNAVLQQVRPTNEISTWAEWARAEADRIDPLTNGARSTEGSDR